MYPYFMLLLIPGAYLAFKRLRSVRFPLADAREIALGTPNKVVVLFFWILFLLLACRAETIGRDLPNYKYIFQVSTQGGLEHVFESTSEVLFRLYNWIIYQFTDNYRVYLILTAIVCVVPIAYIYKQQHQHTYLMLVVFINMSTFVMLFSGLRQSMAMAIGMLAYHYVKEKKIMPFLAFAAVASLIHHSGFMIFFMYPMYHIRIKKKMFIIVLSAIAFVFLFKERIFNFATKLLGGNFKYEVSAGSTGAYASLVMFAMFATFTFIITDERICDKETLGLRNFLVLTVILQCFAPLYSLAMRMNYYYILFVPLALAKSLTYSKKQDRLLATFAEYVMCLFFTLYFVITTYQSCVSGESLLDTIPYLAFWK